MDARLAMRVPSELMERLQEAARRDERTVPQLVRLILRRALDDLERSR
jgi:predicted DNA-binding protein